jgi:hypothetical protein
VDLELNPDQLLATVRDWADDSFGSPWRALELLPVGVVAGDGAW